MNDCMHELQYGQLLAFKDWPVKTVPQAPGAYTIWNQAEQFLYVGIALEGGLFSRLRSHANGRRGGDQFNVYVADRLVLQMLTPEQIAQISAGTLSFDELIRDYTRVHLSFRFCLSTDPVSIERLIRAGRWPHGTRPILNPDGPSRADRPPDKPIPNPTEGQERMTEQQLEEEFRNMRARISGIETMALLFGIRFANELKDDAKLRNRLAQNVLGRQSGTTILNGCKLAPYVSLKKIPSIGK